MTSESNDEDIKKIERLLMKSIIAFILIGYAISGCSYINKKIGQKDDWFGEELVERIIKNEFGLDIDLSPDSKEK